jgi:hypothetical protein
MGPDMQLKKEKRLSHSHFIVAQSPIRVIVAQSPIRVESDAKRSITA